MNTTSRNPALAARARRYISDAGRAFDHAPVEVSLSVLLAITFSWMVANDSGPFPEWMEIAVIVALMGAGAFGATLLHALGAWTMRTRWIATAAAAAIAALYGVLVLDLQLAAETWRAAALVAAAALLLIAVPAFAHPGEATATFRRVSGRLLLRTAAVLLYAAALFAGLALALGAVNTLFELNLSSRIYAHVFGWIFIVLVTWVVVGGVPDYVRPVEEAGAVESAVHRLSAWLVTPLLAVYYVILYAYAVRIALTGELPKNLVSPLVIAAGVIAAVALVLFDRVESRHAALRSLRAAAPLFVPLAVLGVWALNIRIEQYGWTEFRGMRMVLLIALGGVAAAAAVLVMRRRALPLHVLPLALAATLVLSVVGPWSVLAGSRRSQQGRLAEALSAAGIDGNARVPGDSTIANEQFTAIQETSRYLATHFGSDALPPLFARHVEERGRFADVAWEAGLRPAQLDVVEAHGGFGQLRNGALLGSDTTGATFFVRLERHVQPGDTAAGSSGVMRLRIPVAGMHLVADLSALAAAIASRRGGDGSLPPDLARVPVRDDSGRERGELFVLEIGFGREGSTTVVHRLLGIVRMNTQ